MKKLIFTKDDAKTTKEPRRETVPEEVRAAQVLVVDDHLSVRESVAAVLREAGLNVQCCGGGAEALQACQGRTFHCVISDLQMPGMDGLELMRELAKRNNPARVVMITAHASVATAVEAMRLGAFDYLEKPCDLEKLERLVFQAVRHAKNDSVTKNATTQTSNPETRDGSEPVMIGSSRIMEELRKRIAMIAPHSETVLISGENGTGKEIVAKMIHAKSPRSDRPWMTLNCPALSPQLMESELFGHKKGAFTGAEHDRIGRFEAAGRGTLLLDEISEIDLNLQPKLLRVLQERAFEKVGSSETIASHARVIATTNRNLETEIAEGRFREDLYYRLAVLPIRVPSLRERREDIPELFEWFLRQATQRLGIVAPKLCPGVMETLIGYDWPGNVRQLENIVTRIGVFGDDTVTLEDLRRWLSIDEQTCNENDEDSTTISETPLRIITGRYNEDSGEFALESETETQGEISCRFEIGTSLDEVEREMIEATLEFHDGHRAKTAQTLGIGVRTLTGKLRQYGYAPREKKKSA